MLHILCAEDLEHSLAALMCLQRLHDIHERYSYRLSRTAYNCIQTCEYGNVYADLCLSRIMFLVGIICFLCKAFYVNTILLKYLLLLDGKFSQGT